MTWFTSIKKEEPADQPSDYQKVFGKLAQVQAEILATERERDQASLAIALGDSEDAGKDVLARLASLREKEALLQAAMRQAEAAERANLGRLGAREHEARKRSLNQKSGQLRRDQQRCTAAACEYRDAYRAMVQTAASIAALLPSNLRDDYEGMLSQGAIKKLCEVESYRSAPMGFLAPAFSTNRSTATRSRPSRKPSSSASRT